MVRQSRGHGRSDSNLENYKYYFPVLAVIMLLGVVLLFKDFIFSDKMLYGSDTINAGAFFRHFYVEYIKMHGAVPVWNPYIFGGMPFIDAFHGDIFYPLSILKFVNNIFRTLGYNLVLHIFLSGLFMYFTARQFRLNRVASTLSGVAYMFSGFLVSLVAPGHDGKIFVTTLFPLTILFLERAFERKPLLNFMLLGLVIGIIILSPHPQLSYYSLWGIFLYGIFKLVFLYREKRSISSLIKPGTLLISAVVLGLLISAVQFYPGYIYTTNYSPRAETKRGYDWATSWSMHEQEAFSLIVPEFSGNNSGENNYYWGKNAFKDNSEYMGIIPLFLAFIALFFYRRKEAYFFGGLALFSLIYALGGTTPLFRVFYYLIPNVKSLRAPSTIMFMFLFSVSLMAGMGVQYLIDRGQQLSAATLKKLKGYLIGFPAVLLLFALLFSVAGETMLSLHCSIFYRGIESQMIGQGSTTKWHLALMNLPNVQNGLWIVFFFVAAAAAAIMVFLSRKAGTMVLMILPLLTMIDGIRFDSKFIKPYDYREQFTSNAITDYFNSLPEKFRVLNLDVVPKDYLPFFNIEVITGYHGNQLRWYDDLLGGPALSNKGNPFFLNLVGARYILAPSQSKLPPGYFGPDTLIIARDFGNIAVYKNNNALPRAFLVDRFEIVPDRKDIYPKILSGQTDLRRTVYLEEKPAFDIIPGDSILQAADIISYANDSIIVDIKTSSNSILVLTDNYYRAWEARVDGVETPILRADGTFRAVPVKAGAKRVIFKYNRSMNNSAGMVTLLALLLVLTVLAVDLRNNLKNKKGVPTSL